MKNITIIGCGHGGQALAVELVSRGHCVSMYADPNHLGGLTAIKEQKGIYSKGELKGFFPIAKVTTDVSDAIRGSDFIFIVLPSFAHESTFINILPFVTSGQTIVTLAANYASLVYQRLLDKTHKHKKINLVDIGTLPYVCRSDNKGNVEIISIKNQITVASLPGNVLPKIYDDLQSLLSSQLIAYKDVLSLGLNITSGITHPVITLLNAGRLGKDTFYFYKEGISQNIAEILERMDQERQQIAKALGLQVYTYLELMEQHYGIKYDCIYDFFTQSKPHNALPLCPPSTQHRYITQDVANLLVPWQNLATIAGVQVPVISNVINMASLINQTNYMRHGSDLLHLGLHNRCSESIKTFVLSGELPHGDCEHLSVLTNSSTMTRQISPMFINSIN